MQVEQFLKNYINGELVEPLSGQYIDNVEPATGKVYANIPSSDAKDVEKECGSAFC